MPRLQPATGAGDGLEGRGPKGIHVVYHMIVPLKASPRHVFCLELGPEDRGEELCIRMELQCMCTKEQQMWDMLCFLHYPEDQLRRQQMPSLPQTLCIDSYLEMEKTATNSRK